MIVDSLLRVALLGSAWVLYLLLALSVVSIGAMLERWLYFRKHRDDPDALREKLSRALLADDVDGAERVLDASRSVEALVIRRALRWRVGGARAVADAVDSELGRARAELERGTSLLGTLGNNAPFIGLFGTVLGVIDAFKHLGAAGTHGGSMGSVMTGIAEALVATGVGIFVAIPAVVAFNVVQKRIGEIENDAVSLGKLVTAWLETRERTGGGAQASGAHADAHADAHVQTVVLERDDEDAKTDEALAVVVGGE